MNYTFTVEDEGDVVFSANKPTIEMLEEEIGRYERKIQEGYRAVGDGTWIK